MRAPREGHHDRHVSAAARRCPGVHRLRIAPCRPVFVRGTRTERTMADLIRRVVAPWASSRLSPIRFDHGRALRHLPQARPRVLVVGAYLSEKPNLIDHLVRAFASSRHCAVTQRWAAIGRASTDPAVAAVTVEEVRTPTPKFALVNRLLEAGDFTNHDYLVVCDDDIRLPRDFVDRFIGWQQHCGFSLAQPARTWNSFVDHGFVRQSLRCKARETRFVEIGPLFCFDRAMASLALPFDPLSPMGWGYDLVWPALARAHGLTLGIVDDAAVEHCIRPQGAMYSRANEQEAMARFLARREHLTYADAIVVNRRYR